MGFHAKQLPKVVDKALGEAGISKDSLEGVRAIAVTNRPGLSGSLSVGVKYAKYLSAKHNVPVIPIHHMEAHAITVRMLQKVRLLCT